MTRASSPPSTTTSAANLTAPTPQRAADEFANPTRVPRVPERVPFAAGLGDEGCEWRYSERYTRAAQPTVTVSTLTLGSRSCRMPDWKGVALPAVCDSDRSEHTHLSGNAGRALAGGQGGGGRRDFNDSNVQLSVQSPGGLKPEGGGPHVSGAQLCRFALTAKEGSAGKTTTGSRTLP